MTRSISIIIPVHNRAALVARAVDSVRAQAGVRARVIIVDDGSTDDTPRVLQRYEDDESISVVRHATNRGVTAAKNTGLDQVSDTTDLVGILDSDDFLEPGALQALAAVFEAPGGDQWSQAFGWCRDVATGGPTGTTPRREGRISYDDVLAGRFAGEFWQLARMDLIGDRRFELRARGGEWVVWWSLLRERPGWLIAEVVRGYDTGGADRVSRIDYGPAAARGTMWVYRAGLRAFGRDLKRAHPARFADLAAELAKWAALAGERRLARAAARAGLRAHRSRRGALMLVLARVPPAALRVIAGARAAQRVGAPGASPEVPGRVPGP